MQSAGSLLLTDLYELTMLHAYLEAGMSDTATFELFSRALPEQRNFLVAAGVAPALEFIEQARFTPDELEWLAGLGRFPPSFIDFLANWRFTGDVRAVPEGTLVFPNEPMLQITAPLAEAQLLESRLINLVHFQTLIASKAARCVLAAPDHLLVDFGLRRAHGSEAGILAARATYLAGFAGTATVAAGRRFGIPLFGTMAHSYIQAHDSELEAFRTFTAAQPENLTYLIDTYDTEDGARKVVALSKQYRDKGLAIRAVRLDSGDLADHARRVRTILDAGGLEGVRIFSSGNLDEYALAALVRDQAPIDGFGVGTRVTTSADDPYLDCVYKLTEYAGRPKRKRAEGKATWPGRKQIWRRYDSGGVMAGDIIGRHDETQEGEALLVPVLYQGQRVGEPEPLERARERVAAQLQQLPPALRTLEPASPYPVEISAAVHDLAAAADAESRRSA